MKSLRLLACASTACLFLGTSGAAMAVGCPTGTLVGVTVDEIVIDGQSCYIEGVIVNGDVTVTNSEAITVVASVINGNLRVGSGEFANIGANQVGLADGITGDVLVSNFFRVAVLLVSLNWI